MQPWSAAANHVSLLDLALYLGKVLACIATAISLGRMYLRRRTRDRLALGNYTSDDLQQYRRYYVEPDLQRRKPNLEQQRDASPDQRMPAFSWLDQAFSKRSSERFFLLLAESGMGKSSLLLNYAGRRISRLPFRTDVLVCRSRDLSDNLFKDIPLHHRELLLVDALDEDPRAWPQAESSTIERHSAAAHARLRELLKTGQTFKRTLVACRTQFFADAKNLPTDTGVENDPRPAGVPATYQLVHIYLCPFDEKQVSRFVRRRYRFSGKKRREVEQLVRSVPHLAMRPMLLAYADYIVGNYSADGKPTMMEVYQEMIAGWLVRERCFAGSIAECDLFRFSVEVARRMYINLTQGSPARLTNAEVQTVASSLNITLRADLLASRSLLTRVADHWQFVHASILEYLFIVSHLQAPPSSRVVVPWTAQMKAMLREILMTGKAEQWFRRVDSSISAPTEPQTSPIELDLCRVDLSGENLTGAVIPGMGLVDARLSQAVLGSAVLSKANLSGTDLRQIDARSADISGAHMSNADLARSDLRQVKLHRTDLCCANLTYCNLEGADLTGAAISEASFSGANLARARLADTLLSKANFSEDQLVTILETSANRSDSVWKEAIQHPQARHAVWEKIAADASESTLLALLELPAIKAAGDKVFELVAQRLSLSQLGAVLVHKRASATSIAQRRLEQEAERAVHESPTYRGSYTSSSNSDEERCCSGGAYYK